MVIPFLLLGYSLLTANFTSGHMEAPISPVDALEDLNETTPIKLPGDRDKRDIPSTDGPPASESDSMESSTHEAEMRVKRDEDDDTPLHENDYEADKSDVHLAMSSENGTNAVNTTTEESGSSSSEEEHNPMDGISAEMMLLAGALNHSDHIHHHHPGHHNVHDHSPSSPASGEAVSPVAAPSEAGKRRKKRENPAEEPFGDVEENVHSSPEDKSSAGNEGGSIEQKKAGETSGHEEAETATTPKAADRPVRAIGLGHRARTQSVQKGQQQAGRGPKSDGTD